MEDTIFGKIIRREVPAEILFEDEDTLAFLDIAPVAPGHTLVIPKKPFRNMLDIDEESLTHVMRTVRTVAKAVKEATNASGVNVSCNNEPAAGQVVFHFHVHIIPRHENDGLTPWPHKEYGEGEAAAMAEKVRTALA